MDILEKLFGTAAKVKIIKLFLFNPETAFDVVGVSERSKISLGLARKEVSTLHKVGFIRPKVYMKDVKIQRDRRMVPSKKKVTGFMLNYKFEHLEILYNFLSSSNALDPHALITKLSKGAKLDLLIIAGMFIKQPDSRVDLLIVGEHIKENVLQSILKTLEADIGREIRYAIFTTTEFKYRISVFDKLIRDILDYPHEKVVNKLSL